ncbi:cytochrome b5 domain-containing protein 1 [Aricia agestis]|uniref:cytochrome b5 domain-containing protein 1 n=1 Tax=Aricia agestis TaxID=91739 RepID=UPI001C208927|nr:cytochrome b5 domain-containing protein 1 [Aricia agestis]
MIYTKQEWYTPSEVVIHNTLEDCWVSVNGFVRNLTPWLQDQWRFCKCVKRCSCAVKNWYCEDTCREYCRCSDEGYLYCDAKTLAMIVLAYAGKDVTHWFVDGEWVHYTHPIVGSRTPFHTHGAGNRQPVVPSTRWRPLVNPWWLDDSNIVGKLTSKPRPVRITNTLTGSSVTLEVCSEETIHQIMMRYLPHNSHMASYTWCHGKRVLDCTKTLEENGIPDERDRYLEVGLPENVYIPNIMLYYNDDMTTDPPKHIDCDFKE